MPSQDNAFVRHQQARWLRGDAYRWVRPDAARFLAPGMDVKRAYPALALKYSPNQPRVPSGNPDGGQWTDGDGGGGARPRVIIDTTDLDRTPRNDARDEIDGLGLFGITPREPSPQGVQIAGDPPHEGLLNQHVMQNHVAKTDDELVARIRESQFKTLMFSGGLHRNGSFDSEDDARYFIQRTLDDNSDEILRVVSGEQESAFLTKRFGGSSGKEAILDPTTGLIRIRRTFSVGISIVRLRNSKSGYRIRTAYPRNDD